MAVDLRLYAIVDPETSGGHDWAKLARRVVAGGAPLISALSPAPDPEAAARRLRAVVDAALKQRRAA